MASIVAFLTVVSACGECSAQGVECDEPEFRDIAVTTMFEPPSDDIRDCILQARMAVMMTARQWVSGGYE